jgi:hypothetical protein
MKTPREILLERHRAAQPKLDAVRRAALATVKNAPESPRISLRQWLQSLRWHVVGLGAAWLFILFLRLDTNRVPGTMAAIPPAKIPPSQVIMASLRENRRQLLEMMEANLPAGKPPELFPAGPRSERREETVEV